MCKITIVRKCLSMTLLLCLCMWLAITAEAQEEKIVRVGFPILKGLSEIDANGNYDGYTYEYLREIAKYTGWEYEYVPREEAQMEDLLDMLEKGEIDLLPGLVLNEETKERFAFPEYDCGKTYSTLSVLRGNTRIQEGDFQMLEGIRIAMLPSAVQTKNKVDNFFSSHQATYKPIYCDTRDKMWEALLEGEADAMPSGDLAPDKQLRVVAHYGAQPFYMAVNRGKTEVLSGVNYAIGRIKEINVNYDLQLYARYFAPLKSGSLVLSDREKSYIQAMGPLTVASALNSTPLAYFDRDGAYHGIFADIFLEISKSTGMEMRYIQAKNLSEGYRFLREGRAQLLNGVPDDAYFVQESDMALTVSYVSAPMVMIKRAASKQIGQGLMGMLTGIILRPDLRNPVNIRTYDNTTLCLQDLQRKEIDYCYDNVYVVEAFVRDQVADDLEVVALPDSNETFCIALPRPTDTMLLGILNKAIHSIDAEKIQRIVFENISAGKQNLTVYAFVRAHVAQVIWSIVLTATVILCLAVAIMYKKRLMEEQFILRYQMLADLTGEILLEYNFKSDQLSLTGKTAPMLGLKPVERHYRVRLRNGEFLPQPQELWPPEVENSTAQLTECTQEVKWICALGEEKWFHAVFIILRDRKGRARVCMGKLRDIDSEVHEKRRLLQMASQDALTGIYNKGAMQDLCKAYLEEASGKGFCVLLVLDIDNFKSINDTWGHWYGDEALKSIAKRLKSTFRPYDLIGRIGGDEFVVLIKDLEDMNFIRDKANQALSALCQPLEIGESMIPLSCSIGVSRYPPDGITYDELYKNADIALYEMKNSGKRGCKYFSRDMARMEWQLYNTTAIDSEKVCV